MKLKYTSILLTFFCVSFLPGANAQLSQMGLTYFQNKVQVNPAMAGMEQGLNIHMGYLQQWSNVPGSPKVQTITAEYLLTEKAALGLNFYNDRTGILNRTRTVGTYAYHLPLNSNTQKLSFGLSLGFLSDRVNLDDIKGNIGDPSIAAFNQRETYIDGDFGMAYTSANFEIQAAIPGMKSFLNKDLNASSVDRTTFFSSISYKWEFEGEEGFGLEPKLVYRGIQGMSNVIDAGANLTYANRVNFFGMYHSSKNATFGLGLKYQNFGFTGMYMTSNSTLRNYADGSFEIGLKIGFFNSNISR